MRCRPLASREQVACTSMAQCRNGPVQGSEAEAGRMLAGVKVALAATNRAVIDRAYFMTRLPAVSVILDARDNPGGAPFFPPASPHPLDEGIHHALLTGLVEVDGELV